MFSIFSKPTPTQLKQQSLEEAERMFLAYSNQLAVAAAMTEAYGSMIKRLKAELRETRAEAKLEN